MSKPINPLIYRLGYSQFWSLRTNVFKSHESFKNQYFIVQWLQNFCKKINIFLLYLRAFENNKGNIFLNLLCLSSDNTKNFHWNRFTFIVKKWLNIWYFRQPWNKKHKLWLRNRKFEPKHVFLRQVKRKFFISFFFYKLLFLKFCWMFSMLLKKKVVVNIKNFRFFFKFRNDAFINLILERLTIKTGLLKKRSKKVDTLIFLLTLSLFLKNSKLFGIILAQELEKNRHHSLTLRFLNSILLLIMQRTFNILFKSLIFQVKGKVNAVDRKIKRVFKFGKNIPIQTKKQNINYSLVEAFTFTGVFSIKVWLY